jgi:hypothetical protein
VMCGASGAIPGRAGVAGATAAALTCGSATASLSGAASADGRRQERWSVNPRAACVAGLTRGRARR